MAVPFFDPATQYRKDGAAIRSGILRQITLKHGLDIPASPPPPVAVEGEDAPKPRKKVLPTPPGLFDPLARVKTSLGAAQAQMVQGQVIGILRSFVSNRQNDFIDAVFGSSIEDPLRRQLFTVNRVEAWFDMARSDKVEGEEVPMAARRLASKIMSHILGLHR
jgi:hypothetical protein